MKGFVIFLLIWMFLHGFLKVSRTGEAWYADKESVEALSALNTWLAHTELLLKIVVFAFLVYLLFGGLK